METRCHLPLRLDDDLCRLPQERAERHFRRQGRMSQTGHSTPGSIQQGHQQAPAEARAIPRAQRIHAGLRRLLRGGGHACKFPVSSFTSRAGVRVGDLRSDTSVAHFPIPDDHIPVRYCLSREKLKLETEATKCRWQQGFRPGCGFVNLKSCYPRS